MLDIIPPLQQAYKNKKIPNYNVYIIDHGKHGHFMKGDNINHDTVYQAASISKTIFAILCVILHEKRLINIFGEIDKNFLKKFIEPFLPLTLEDLLTHTAGMSVPSYPGYPQGCNLPNNLDIILNGGGNTQKLHYNKQQHQNKQYMYSGGGYTLAQKYVETVLQLPLDELARIHLFKPLHLTHTYFRLTPSKNHAKGHTANMEMVPQGYHMYPEFAAAGLWSNPKELAMIAQELLLSSEGKSAIISKNSFNLFIKERVFVEKTLNHYGLGIRITQNKTSIYHNGSNYGFKGHFEIDLKNKRIIVSMSSGDNAGKIHEDNYAYK